MSTKDAYDMRTRYRPRFFVRVGHETTVASKTPWLFQIAYEEEIWCLNKCYDLLEKSWFPNFGKSDDDMI